MSVGSQKLRGPPPPPPQPPPQHPLDPPPPPRETLGGSIPPPILHGKSTHPCDGCVCVCVYNPPPPPHAPQPLIPPPPPVPSVVQALRWLSDSQSARLKPQDLSGLAWAFATLGVRHQPLMQRLAARALQVCVSAAHGLGARGGTCPRSARACPLWTPCPPGPPPPPLPRAPSFVNAQWPMHPPPSHVPSGDVGVAVCDGNKRMVFERPRGLQSKSVPRCGGWKLVVCSGLTVTNAVDRDSECSQPL